jgi:hypothetical protein
MSYGLLATTGIALRIAWSVVKARSCAKGHPARRPRCAFLALTRLRMPQIAQPIRQRERSAVATILLELQWVVCPPNLASFPLKPTMARFRLPRSSVATRAFDRCADGLSWMSATSVIWKRQVPAAPLSSAAKAGGIQGLAVSRLIVDRIVAGYGAVTVLRDVSLEGGDGELVALLGLNAMARARSSTASWGS